MKVLIVNYHRHNLKYQAEDYNIYLPLAVVNDHNVKKLENLAAELYNLIVECRTDWFENSDDSETKCVDYLEKFVNVIIDGYDYTYGASRSFLMAFTKLILELLSDDIPHDFVFKLDNFFVITQYDRSIFNC